MDKLIQDVVGAVLGSAVLGGAGLLVTWGMVRQMVRDLKERQTEDRLRIDRLQEQQSRVPELSAAIDHMGDKIATTIQHLAELFSEKHKRFEAELDDLKRANRTRRRSAQGGAD